MRRICVYCGSNSGRDPAYIEVACSLVREMTARNIGLVYGGASIGIMGAIADTAMREGGQVIGVMPQSLVDKEIAHNGLTELRIVGSMHERRIRGRIRGENSGENSGDTIMVSLEFAEFVRNSPRAKKGRRYRQHRLP